MIKITIKKMLDLRHMTQAELSQQTGIRPSTISLLCNNAAISFKFSHLERICAVLKCDITDIITLL